MLREDFLSALRKIIFVMLSYVPLGLACGIALQEAGFTPGMSLIMSLTAYTGSGQFAAASMAAQGAATTSILITVFFLNLRMSLQTSSFLPYIKHRSLSFILGFSQVTTDESYGINMYEFNNNDEWNLRRALTASILAWLTWAFSVSAGAYIGSSVEIPTTVVNYVLIAMFISMMVDQLVSRIHAVVILATIILTVVFQIVLQNSLSIVLATLLASLLGYVIENKSLEKQEREDD